MRFHFDEDKKYLYFEDERCEKVTKKCLKSVFIFFFILSVIVASLYCWFFSNYYFLTVTGRSMQPTLNIDIIYQSDAQDCVIVDKYAEIDYGDIIIIKNPANINSDNTIIKRLLAKEGDKFSIIKIDGLYHLLRIKKGFNDVEVLDESSYIKGYVDWSIGKRSYIDYDQNVVYEAEFYENYIDKSGRYFSSDRVSEVVYDNKIIYFYQIEKNEIFYLGDNRANSSDARYYGPVTTDIVLGKVVKICYNGAYSDFFFVRGFYQLKGLFEYFMPKLVNLFAWKG